MKILPILFFAAFCITVHAQTTASIQEEPRSAPFMQVGQTYNILFGDENKAVHGHTIFQIIEQVLGTNWYLVRPSGNQGAFFINLEQAISVTFLEQPQT